jgi:hypothetical protein
MLIDPDIWKCMYTQRANHATVLKKAKKEQIAYVLIRAPIQNVYSLNGMLNYLTPTK